MNLSTEIRHLPIEKKMGLVSILEFDDSWKKLMAIIPKNVLQGVYDCDIKLKKYRYEDFRLIENHAKKTGKQCADILFYEWGTSGRVRATLGHLKDLLVKADLFRAADYLAVDIMGGDPPARPDKGPSARVVFAPEEELDETPIINEMLDKMSYPSSGIEDMIKQNNVNVNSNIDHSTFFNKPVDKNEKVIPATFQTPIVARGEQEKSAPNLIEFSSLQSEIVMIKNNIVNTNSDLSTFSKPVDVNEKTIPATNKRGEKKNSASDLIEFSSSRSEITSEQKTPSVMKTSEVNMPNMTKLLNTSIYNHPNLDLLGDSSTESSISTQSSATPSQDNVKLSTSWVESSSNIPALSEFNQSSHSNTSLPNNLTVNSINIPELSLLINTSDSNKSLNSKNSRSCISPLPPLSLNTLLPHFTYQQLEAATNNFDETPFSQNGRFLGAGHFGQVFLADGLFSKPVAVKKLLLKNESEVLIDDDVTKQFRNEVEVLSNYKHENLLSLLGYSCDGSTYCLLYEYLPGEALRDRLTKKHQLIWTEGLYIAMGVSKALAYLHTAYSTPMIHRDVSTANILLDNNNKPKLSDFSLSSLDPNHTSNSDFFILGEFAYMSPEAHRGEISILLDTFSFGVVLLELLTSLPPIDKTRDEVDLVSHFKENIKDDISPFLDVSVGDWVNNGVNYAHLLFRIAQKCLYEQKHRPTMADVSQELMQLMRTQSS